MKLFIAILVTIVVVVLVGKLVKPNTTTGA